MLGVLLALLLAIAMFVVFRIYTQLDRAAKFERRVVNTQLKLGDVLRVELDEEAGLRGYTATGQTFFLEPYRVAADEFDDTLSGLQQAVDALGSGELDRTIRDVRSVHQSWEESVAKPLIKAPRSHNALTRQTLGKILIDQVRGDIDHAKGLLDGQFAMSQEGLRRTIDQSLFGGLATVLVFGGVAISFVASRSQMLATIDRGRSIVETLQGAFRTDLDAIPGISIGTAYLSATQDAAVGGDLYDVRAIEGGRGLVIVADVSGKGVEAAVNTAFVKYSIRTLAHASDSPAHILTQFNRIFLETIKNPNLFVVTFLAVIDVRARTMTYACAGASGAYLRSGGAVRQLDVTGTVIGLDAAFTYGERVVPLASGDIVLLATDGLTEARDAAGELLDDAGAMRLLQDAPHEAQACADALAAAVRARSGNEPSDDLAIVAIGVA